MPVNQRLAMAQEIIASVMEENAQLGSSSSQVAAAPLTELQRQEIRSRLERLEAHPEDVIPGEVVMQEARARNAALRS